MGVQRLASDEECGFLGRGRDAVGRAARVSRASGRRRERAPMSPPLPGAGIFENRVPASKPLPSLLPVFVLAIVRAQGRPDWFEDHCFATEIPRSS